MHPSLPTILSASLLATAVAQTSQPKPTDIPPLPITHVSLYKNGVGFFEHTAHLTGSPTLSLTLTSAQLNDVLQTLTAIDLGGGHLTSANFNSTTPLAQQLANVPFSLGNPSDADPNPTQQDLYTALRGTKVEVRGAGPAFTGRILSLELRSTADHAPSPATEAAAHLSDPARVLTLISDSGATRSLTLTSATTVRLLDPALRTDLNTYLALLDRNRDQGLRHLTLTDHAPTTSPTTPRELRVSFLSEVPVWKSTYRLLLTSSAAPAAQPATNSQATVQGFSVIDNTTGEDWTNIHLSLIAGSPQSFLQPLATPIYTRRPEISIAENAQLTPQTHDAATDMIKEDGAPPPQVAGVAGMSGMAGGSAGGVLGGIMGGAGNGPNINLNNGPIDRIGPGSAGNSGGGLISSSHGTVTESVPYATLAQATTAASTNTAATDTLFAYNLIDPISIPRNGSALVPILTATLPAESVTLWSPSCPIPLRALSVTNTSSLTLDRGSFSVVEDGSFAGEGLLDTIHPGEHRLLSFAGDQAVRVSADSRHDTRRVSHLSVQNGILRATNIEIAEVEYLVNDVAPTARTVIVEEPRRAGWELDSSANGASKSSDSSPTETTPTAFRFRVVTQPHETVRLHISQRHTLTDLFRLTDTTEPQLALYLRDHAASSALLQQLAPVFAAQTRLNSLDTEIANKQAVINTLVADQARVRNNLAALKGTSDERALARRYTAELNTQEDTLTNLRDALTTLQNDRTTSVVTLNTTINNLTLDASA